MATTAPTAAGPVFQPVNVVPGNYKWSHDVANKKREKGKFVRVGGPSNQTSERSLTGYKRTWGSADPKEANMIFCPDCRIAGTPEDVRLALRYANVSAEDIEHAIANAITRDNYTANKAKEFGEEIERAKGILGTKKPTAGYNFDQIKWFAENLHTAQVTTKAGEATGVSASPARRGATRSLSEKVTRLAPGKVLDVSNMDLNTGTGVRTAIAPKSDKGGRFGFNMDRVPIISNNLERYVRALELAYGPNAQQQYAGEIAQMQQALAGMNKRQPSQAAMAAIAPYGMAVPRPPSPSKAGQEPVVTPGAALAPVPSFRPSGSVPQLASPRATATVQPIATTGAGGMPVIPPLSGLLGQHN